MSLSKTAYTSWKFYLHLLQSSPIQTKALTAGLLTLLGNVLTQKVFEKKPNFDTARALKFVAFSLLLTPISHYWYKFLDSLFPKRDVRKIEGNKQQALDLTPVKKLLLDELIYDPFCIVFFYTVIGLLEGKDFQQIKQTVATQWWPTQKMSWRVWPIVQLINFSVVPGHLRILFINCVSFWWGIFMQLKAGKQ
jgi:hypothetical protein